MASDGETRWPEGFMDIGGKSFDWVFQNRKEWVEFTLNEMKKPSGLFLEWKSYCVEKVKEERCQSTSPLPTT